MKLIVIDMQKALMDDELYHRDQLLQNVTALIAAARAGFYNILVTDSVTAESIYEAIRS